MRANPRMLKVLTLMLACTTLISILCLYGNDPELLARHGTSFLDPEGETLIGYYYPGRIARGAVILHGFSSDQASMKNVASELASMGLHILTFDFSGHGQSPSTITFDNAQRDRLAKQVLAAKAHLKTLTGLDDGDMVFIGHSMGARVAIEAETQDANPVAGVVAMGASINLLPNTQSEFFTGTSDIDIAWIQGLNATNPAVDLLLITGAWDDILTPAAASALIAKLQVGGSPGTPERRLEIIPATVHNYEIYSPGVMSVAKEWIAGKLGLSGADTSAFRTIARAAWWIVFTASIFGCVLSGTSLLDRHGKRTGKQETLVTSLSLQDAKKFILAKFFLWFLALFVGFGISLVFFALPLGLPVFNLIYIAFIGGYGVLLVLLYGRGKMPGMKGKLVLNSKREFTAMTAKDWIASIAVMGGITVACTLFFNTGLSGVYPLNDRLAWLGIFTTFIFFGFYIGQVEREIIDRAGTTITHSGLLLGTIGLFPFGLVAALFVALGSTSGMIGSLQGILVLALSLACGPLVKATSKNKVIVALFQAFLLQLLIGAQGALFALV
jgi:dienelactone hydrolase